MGLKDLFGGLFSKEEKPIRDFPRFDENDIQASISAIYDWVVDNAKDQIAWYDRKRPHKRLWSQGTRIITLLLFGFGIICPLIDTGLSTCNPPQDQCSTNFLKLGYVLIASAGAIVLFDKYFGLSTGWMRFMETQLKMEEGLKEFYHDWALLELQENSDENDLNKLQTLKQFTMKVEQLVQIETRSWAKEFTANISNIDEMINKNRPKTQ